METMEIVMDAFSALPVMNNLHDALSGVEDYSSLICLLGCAIDQWQADHSIPDEVMDDALQVMMRIRKQVRETIGPCTPVQHVGSVVEK